MSNTVVHLTADLSKASNQLVTAIVRHFEQELKSIHPAFQTTFVTDVSAYLTSLDLATVTSKTVVNQIGKIAANVRSYQPK